MAKVCTTYYLDENFNPSAHYYANEHLGHETAERLYLESLKSAAFTKFQKSGNFKPTIQNMLDTSKDLKSKMASAASTTNRGKKDNVFSPSQFLVEVGAKPNFDEEILARDIARNTIAKSVISKHIINNPSEPLKSKIDPTLFLEFTEEQKRQINAGVSTSDIWFNKEQRQFVIDNDLLDSAEVENMKQALLKEWDMSRKFGDEFHSQMENFINYINSEFNGNSGSRLGAKDMVSNYILSRPASERPVLNDYYKESLEQLFKIMDQFKGPNFRFLSEVSLDSPKLGVMGTSDLIVVNEVTGEVHIFDYKTKKRDKFDNFDAQHEKLDTPPFESLWNNPKTDVELQTDLYSLILEDMGFKVKTRSVIYVEASFGGTVSNISIKDTIELKSHRGILRKFFKGKGIEIDNLRFDNINGKNNNEMEVISSLSGSYNGESDPAARAKHTAILLNEKRLKGDKIFYNDKLLGKQVEITETDPAKIEQILLDYYKKENDQWLPSLANSMIDYFYSDKQRWPGRKSNNVYETEANRLMSDISPKTHTLEKVQNLPGMENVGPMFLLATDKDTGVGRIIAISPNPDFDNFSELKEGNTTIFGKYISDEALMSAKYGFNTLDGIKASSHNFRLLAGGLLALRLRANGHITKIDGIVSGTVTGRGQGAQEVPKYTSIGLIAPQLKVLRDLKGFQDTAHPDFLTLLKSDPIVEKDKSQTFSYAENLLIHLGESNYHRRKGKDSTKLNLRQRQSGIKALEDFKSGAATRLETLKKLGDLMSSIATTKKLNKPEDLYKIEDYQIVALAYLELAGHHFQMGEAKDLVDKLLGGKIKTPNRINNELINLLQSIAHKTELDISRVAKNFINSSEKVTKELLNSNPLSRTISADGSKEFKNLFEIHPDDMKSDTYKNSLDKAFKLKDPDDMSNNLTEAERKYIRHFNEKMDEALKRMLTEEEYSTIYAKWPKGTIPLVKADFINKAARQETIKGKLKEFGASLKSGAKNSVETFRAVNDMIESTFMSQVTSPSRRLRMLGVDETGMPLGESTFEGEYETNLEAILNSFYLDSIEVERSANAMSTFNAISTVISLEKDGHFKDLTKLDDYVKKFTQTHLHSEVDDEGKLGETIDKTAKWLTLGALGLKPLQYVVEAVTNATQSLAGTTAQAMMGKSKRFNAANKAKANLMVMGNTLQGAKGDLKAFRTVEWINTNLGIHSTNKENLRGKKYLVSRKSGWAQTRLIWEGLTSFQRKHAEALFIATLDNMGILDAITKGDDGEIKYQVTKDKRFEGILNADGTLKPNLTGEEDLKKAALYRYLVDSNKEEGTLDENGVPTIPLSGDQIIEMRDYSATLFGSSDKFIKGVGHHSSIMRAFLHFRSWIPLKLDTYWTDTDNANLTRGELVYIEDPNSPEGGYMEWQGARMEGIIQTINAMRKNMVDNWKQVKAGEKEGSPFGNPLEGLNKNQKENLATFASHVIMMAVSSILIMLAFDDEDEKWKTGAGAILKQGIINGTSDLNTLRLVSSLSTGSPMMIMSQSVNLLNKVEQAAYYSATGDMDKALEQLAKTTGLTKNLYQINIDPDK